MDPVTAFGVASSVLQVVDFGRQAAKGCLEVYKHGASVENLSIERVTKHLGTASETLLTTLDRVTVSEKLLSEDDRRLQALAIECGNIAQDLLDLIERLKPAGAGGSRTWQAVKKGVSSMWERDEVRRMERELERLKDVMDTQILVRLTARFDVSTLQYSEAFAQLDQRSREIIAGVASNKHSIVTKIAAEHAYTRESFAQTLTGIRKGLDSSRQHEELLNSLYFDTIFSRQEEITDSHRETFQWIFDESTSPTQNNFVTWLEHGIGLYWIKGKAGSGKSTLMKFIGEDARTTKALNIWAESSDLCIVSYFIWTAGATEQRSFIGMLKSLLYQVLEAYPDLTSAATALRATVTSKRNRAWTSARLRSTLYELLRQTQKPLKICFVLDGLDEMRDDQEPLLEFLHQLGQEPNAKLCTSTRPLRAFELAFSQAPMLQLHDLTYHDIHKYTLAKLRNHSRMQHLEAEDPETARQLILQVVSKAQGVFLWVALVVRQLLTGLDNEDSLDQLLQRLELIPAEIEDLYALMLSATDSIYHQQAVKYFSLMLTCRGGSMHLLDFALAEGEPADAPLFAKCGGYTAEAFATNAQSFKVKLMTRCMGLLEIQDDTSFSQTLAYGHRYTGHMLDTKLRRWFDRFCTVRWLHRTVPDFLQGTERGQSFMALDTKSQWMAYQGHIISHLGRLRLASSFMEINAEATCKRHIDNIMFYAAKAEATTGVTDETFMDYIDVTMTRIGTSFGITEPHWCSQFTPATDFVGFAASKGVLIYVNTKLNKHDWRQGASFADYLLQCMNLRYWDYRDQALYCETLIRLLKRGRQPNASNGGTWDGRSSTPWMTFLQYVCRTQNRKRSPRGAWISTAIAFVEAGADVTILVPFGHKDGYRAGSYILCMDLSPSVILAEYFSLIPAYAELEQMLQRREAVKEIHVTNVLVKGQRSANGLFVVRTEQQSDALIKAWRERQRFMENAKSLRIKAQDANERYDQAVECVLLQLGSTISPDDDAEDVGNEEDEEDVESVTGRELVDETDAALEASLMTS